MTPKPDVEAWAVKCAEAIAEDHFWHAPPSAIDQIAARIAEHAEAAARERERAVVEECIRLILIDEGRFLLPQAGEVWIDRAEPVDAIRERFAAPLGEEGKP